MNLMSISIENLVLLKLVANVLVLVLMLLASMLVMVMLAIAVNMKIIRENGCGSTKTPKA